jgi:hypothetical protein
MTWNLFLDDERELADVTWAPWQVREKYRNEEWVVCRSYGDAMIEILNRGFPKFVSFDHDLGEKYSGFDLAKRLVENDIISGSKESRQGYVFTADFDYYVHSQNPIGKANIEGLINGYLKAKARIAEVPADPVRAAELLTIAMNDEDGNITVGKLK